VQIVRKQVGVQLPTSLLTRHCSHLLLTAVLLWMWIDRLLQTRRAAIDRYRLPAEPTAANPRLWRNKGQADRRTPYRYIHPAVCCASNVNKFNGVGPRKTNENRKSVVAFSGRMRAHPFVSVHRAPSTAKYRVAPQ